MSERQTAPAVVVFAGPCFHRLDDIRRAELCRGMELRPPARRGDLITALRDGLETIVLLDGFFDELSVAHKELLHVLESGVRVIGAASMGALRAVEMAPLGMIGVGAIHDWYAQGVLDGDDEVAVLHLPEEHGYALETLALVEVRHALGGLVEREVCRASDAADLVSSIKHLGFQERSPARVRALATRRLGEAGARALERALETFSLKEQDARCALDRARTSSVTESADSPDSTGADRAEDRTVFLTHWLAEHTRAPAATSLPGRATLAQAWNVAQLFHDGVPSLVAQLRLRCLAASAARRAGLEADPERLRDRAEALRGYAARHHGAALLPDRETVQEALVQTLAERAIDTFGDAPCAGDWLAEELGLDARGGHTHLMSLIGRQYGLMTSWSFVRAFAFTAALRPALELAEAVLEVDDCFRTWFEGARIDRADLTGVAAGIWGCAAEAVEEEAGARGLLEADGFSEGLREVLQRVAPSERLPRAINDYPARKARLRVASLEAALELLPAAAPGSRRQMWARGPRRDYSVLS